MLLLAVGTALTFLHTRPALVTGEGGRDFVCIRTNAHHTGGSLSVTKSKCTCVLHTAEEAMCLGQTPENEEKAGSCTRD